MVERNTPYILDFFLETQTPYMKERWEYYTQYPLVQHADVVMLYFVILKKKQSKGEGPVAFSKEEWCNITEIVTMRTQTRLGGEASAPPPSLDYALVCIFCDIASHCDFFLLVAVSNSWVCVQFVVVRLLCIVIPVIGVPKQEYLKSHCY